MVVRCDDILLVVRKCSHLRRMHLRHYSAATTIRIQCTFPSISLFVLYGTSSENIGVKGKLLSKAACTSRATSVNTHTRAKTSKLRKLKQASRVELKIEKARRVPPLTTAAHLLLEQCWRRWQVSPLWSKVSPKWMSQHSLLGGTAQHQLQAYSSKRAS